MAANFSYSPLDKIVTYGDDHQELLVKLEMKDIVRALCGALLFAVPLHFTMEMWQRARIIPNWDIALILVGAYLANVGYQKFSSYKLIDKHQAPWYDAFVSMTVGIVASAVTMLLIDQINGEIPTAIVLKTIALEAVPTSFGASLARNQLGFSENVGKKKDDEEGASQDSGYWKSLLASFMGAIMFSFNIAPTMEPILITAMITWYHLCGLILISLLISYMMNYIAIFTEEKSDENGVMGGPWSETLIAYFVSLLVSAVLLWAFGYLSLDTSVPTALSRIVVLGYVTSLGSSAGRIIL